jgi:hypothetical protein
LDPEKWLADSSQVFFTISIYFHHSFDHLNVTLLEFPPARRAGTISWPHTSPEIWRSWIFACRWTTQRHKMVEDACRGGTGFCISQASAGKHGQRSFIAIAQETIEFNLQSFKVGVLQFRLEIS